MTIKVLDPTIDIDSLMLRLWAIGLKAYVKGDLLILL